MTRLAVVALVPLWCGSALLLAELRWFSPTGLADRLRPFTPGAPATTAAGLLSGQSFADAFRPLALAAGEALGRLLRRGSLATRLEQAGSPLDPSTFRMRQTAHGAVALVVVLGATSATGIGTIPTLGSVVGLPLFAHQWAEWRLSAQGRSRREQIRRELPAFVEEVATLLGAGWSLNGALQRVSERGPGAVALDLREVVARIGHGVSERVALREWADRCGVAPLDRLVSVLELNRLTPDVGRLLAAETRSIREDEQRLLIEQLERRGEQVWIPVTVATLVPGAIFLAIPFIEALRIFTAP